MKSAIEALQHHHESIDLLIEVAQVARNDIDVCCEYARTHF